MVIKFTSFCLAGIFSLIVAIASVGIKIGFNVNYSGKTIATVSDTSVFASAKDIAVKSINGEGADKIISQPQFVLTLTVSDNLCTPKKLADAIIKNTENVSECVALVINGKSTICDKSVDINGLLEARRTAFYIKGAENSAEFADTVELKSGYYLDKDIKDISEIKKTIDGLNVKTVSTVVTESAIPYTTKTVRTSSYEEGYHKVTKEGKNGLLKTTVVKETLNGAKSGKDSVSSVTVTEPCEQVEVIGTAYRKISATERAASSSSGFICPLNPGKFKIVAYFGDGRNHKGIDLSADKGTAIFAVADGVVVYSGYRNDYGYSVVVDHGNGIKTRYAHASALCVSVGARVTQGEMIAAVGSTGYSTGNHLHFEVIVNDVRVNPAPYIGL